MGLFDSRETKEKKSHFKNLVMLACVDGDFDDNEKEFLINTGIRWGLTRGQVMSVLKNPDGVKFVIPNDPEKRLAQLEDLVVMILADGVIEQVEVDFVQTLAVKMGLIIAIIEAVRAQNKPDVKAEDFLENG